jgi:dienelactone hydrolase
LLSSPIKAAEKHMLADILVLHGYDDPMVKPADVMHFCDEMSARAAKWEVDMFSHTKHAFTNPEAHDLQNGLVYDAIVAQKAFAAMNAFFARLTQ